eukprot:IDg20085t1
MCALIASPTRVSYQRPCTRACMHACTHARVGRRPACVALMSRCSTHGKQQLSVRCAAHSSAPHFQYLTPPRPFRRLSPLPSVRTALSHAPRVVRNPPARCRPHILLASAYPACVSPSIFTMCP